LGSAEAGELLTPEQIITGFGEGKKKNNLRNHEESGILSQRRGI